LNLKDPDSMNAVIGQVLRYGVIVSAVIIMMGVVRLGASGSYPDISAILTYNPNAVPHGGYNVGFAGILSGLSSLDSFSLIEFGVILLIATPVSRVLISVFLFGAEGDRQYVLITTVVLVLLLFSILATPFIPGFHA
jgi:uncharacterized membrane protein